MISIRGTISFRFGQRGVGGSNTGGPHVHHKGLFLRFFRQAKDIIEVLETYHAQVAFYVLHGSRTKTVVQTYPSKYLVCPSGLPTFYLVLHDASKGIKAHLQQKKNTLRAPLLLRIYHNALKYTRYRGIEFSKAADNHLHLVFGTPNAGKRP